MDCNGLDAFLVDDSMEAAEFKRETERREHLEQRLRMGHPTTVKLSTSVGTGYPFAYVIYLSLCLNLVFASGVYHRLICFPIFYFLFALLLIITQIARPQDWWTN